jgi:hypothetical protein
MAVTIRTKRSNTAGVVPTGLDLGELAINTADNPPSLFVGDGTNVKRVGNVYVGSTAPANPPIGTIWFNDTTDKVSLWNGSAWIDFSGNYVLKSGDTMTGALNVPANAAGTQVPRVQEVVKKSGDSMTGFLTLNADPTNDLHAATKRYVDNATPSVPQPNLIINGGFDVWQRGESFVNPANATYTADRWFVGTNAANCTIDKQFVNGNSSLRFVTTSSGQDIRQRIELPAAGQSGVFQVGSSFTLSFIALSTAPTTFNFYQRFATTTLTQVGSITTTTSPTRYEVTFTITDTPNPTDEYFEVFLQAQGAGVTYFTQVKLEQGSVATPWLYEDYGTTLAKCQRYYYTSQRRIVGYGVVGSEGVVANISMDMRSVPTGTITPTGTDVNVGSDGIVIQTASNSFVFCNPTVTGILKADRIFTLDAEL